MSAVSLLSAAATLLGGVAVTMACGVPAVEFVGASAAAIGLAVTGAAAFVAIDKRITGSSRSARSTLPCRPVVTRMYSTDRVAAPPLALPAPPAEIVDMERSA